MTQEEESIKYVMRYEKRQGRKPVDVSKKLIGYDVKSGNRYIEVKSRPGKNIQSFITLHKSLLRKLGKSLAHYYIYIVYDMNEKPKLTIVSPQIVFTNLETDVKLFLRGKTYNKIKPIQLKPIKKQGNN